MITYRFFAYLIKNIKYTRLLNKIYNSENLLENLSQLFGVTFKKDWIGRVYAVINPNIQDGKYNPSTQIFEYRENGLDNTTYIHNWIMERMNVAEQFIQTQNLFDILTYNIKKLDQYDNYLFIIQPITLSDCLEYSKKFSIILIIILLLFIIFLILF